MLRGVLAAFRQWRLDLCHMVSSFSLQRFPHLVQYSHFRDVESGQMIQNFHGHTGDVFSVDVPKSDIGNIFISGVSYL